MKRSEFADQLEEMRGVILSSIEKCPVEIATLDSDLPFRRLVIDKPSDLDRAIEQLRAPVGSVDPREAVNRTLLVE